MACDPKPPGNIRVNPSHFADKLESLEVDKYLPDIELLEDRLAHRLRLGGAITYINEDGNHVIEDRDGIRPFPQESEFPSPPPSAELEIRELAFVHGFNNERGELDDWCESVSANASDEIRSDEVEQLIIGLGQIEAVDGVKLMRAISKRY